MSCEQMAPLSRSAEHLLRLEKARKDSKRLFLCLNGLRQQI